MLPDLNTTIFPRIIKHIAKFRVLYCHLYKQVCFLSSLHTHLFKIHKVKAAIRQLIVEFCQTLNFVDNTLDFKLPQDGSATLDFALVYNGYSCCCCHFLLVSRKAVRVHLNATHSLMHPISQTKISPSASRAGIHRAVGPGTGLCSL